MEVKQLFSLGVWGEVVAAGYRRASTNSVHLDLDDGYKGVTST